ncbi:MAG: hypothetical protein NVSMB43_07930 [Pseudarthrobacter sp.]
MAATAAAGIAVGETPSAGEAWGVSVPRWEMLGMVWRPLLPGAPSPIVTPAPEQFLQPKRRPESESADSLTPLPLSSGRGVRE